MCLAIVRLPNTFIEKEHLSNAFENHPDGGGLAWAYQGKLYIRKGFFDFDDFYQNYLEIPEESTALIHTRSSTHKVINTFNCHPFAINDEYCLIHNGYIDGFGTEVLSDTNHFVNYVLKPLFSRISKDGPAFLKAGWFHYLIHQVSKYNKIAILHSSGEYFINGESSGHWRVDNKYLWDTGGKAGFAPSLPKNVKENAAWFSNSSYHLSRAEMMEFYKSQVHSDQYAG